MPEVPKSDEAESEETKLRSWWQTVPGVLSAVAAVITAVTGLTVAVYQIKDSQVGAPPGSQRASPEKPDAVTAQSNSKPQPASSDTPASQRPSGDDTSQRALALPAGMQVKLAEGDIVYKILSVRLEPYNADKDALRFTIRCTNNGLVAMNFWDSSFRLLVGGVPRAPISGLNELVEGRSAKEGDVVFEVPTGENHVVLQISAPTPSGSETTEIPFDLTAAKP